MPIARISTLRTRRAYPSASFEPAELKMLGEIFDELWAHVGSDFSGDPDEIEAVRMRLAMIILDLAKDGQLDSLQIVRTASRLIRQTSRGNKLNPSDRGLERNS